MLSSFYKDTNLDNHPRVCVFFNNISKFDKKPSEKQTVTWKDFIKEYKEMLLAEMVAAYENVFDKAYLKERIDKLLPDGNFYFYKIRKSEAEQK